MISVIVCTYQRQRYLPRLFTALDRQSSRPREVLVVDNEDSPVTRALVAEWSLSHPKLKLRHVPERQLGLSHARNRGLREASGELLAFLDDDAAPDPSWLAALETGAAEYPQAGVFSGPVRLDFEQPAPPALLEELKDYLHWLGRLDLGSADRRLQSDQKTYRGPVGANMIIRRTAAAEVPPFPTTLGRQGSSLLSGEEILYVLEIEQRGWQSVYLARARVLHSVPPTRMTPAWFVERSFADGRSIAVMADELRRRHGAAAGRGDAAAILEEKLVGLLAVLGSIGHAGLTFARLPLAGQIDLAGIMGAVMEESRLLGAAAGPRGRSLPGSLRALAGPMGPGAPAQWRRWLGLDGG
jgi:glucosyl-dolichyl phosphate glucuronosyltransferase